MPKGKAGASHYSRLTNQQIYFYFFIGGETKPSPSNSFKKGEGSTITVINTYLYPLFISPIAFVNFLSPENWSMSSEGEKAQKSQVHPFHEEPLNEESDRQRYRQQWRPINPTKEQNCLESLSQEGGIFNESSGRERTPQPIKSVVMALDPLILL